MTTQVTGTKFRAGKVVIGPRAIGNHFYRIISLQDRSGRIETYDPQSRKWLAAPEDVSFTDVWKAEPVSQFALDRACSAPIDIEDDELVEDVDQAGEAQAQGIH